jgi:hypothetical protein
MDKKKEEGNCWPTESQQLLIKSAVFKSSSALEAWTTWLQRERSNFNELDHASYHLFPLVYRNLEKYNPDGIEFQKCKGAYRQTWAANQMLWNTLSPVLNQLATDGVYPYLLLKGIGLIAGYYRDFGVRVIGDVDILVPVNLLVKSTIILQKAGFQTTDHRFDPTRQSGLILRNGASFFFNNDTCLDLHWSFLLETAFTNMDQIVFRDAFSVSIQGQKYFIPSPTDLLFHTCVHGIHASPVPLIRWIVDSLTILHQSRDLIDWKKLIAMAECAHLSLILTKAFRYLNDYFSAEIPVSVISALQKESFSFAEQQEYRSKMRGQVIETLWWRYCLWKKNNNFVRQFFSLPRFLQYLARLQSIWQVPFYLFYWGGKRIFRWRAASI